MTTATRPALTNAQSSDRARHLARITRLARKLDVVLEDYNESLGNHPKRIARAIAELNDAIGDAEAFRRSLGECDPYPRVDIVAPKILEQDGAVFDAVYYDLDELPMES